MMMMMMMMVVVVVMLMMIPYIPLKWMGMLKSEKLLLYVIDR